MEQGRRPIGAAAAAAAAAGSAATVADYDSEASGPGTPRVAVSPPPAMVASLSGTGASASPVGKTVIQRYIARKNIDALETHLKAAERVAADFEPESKDGEWPVTQLATLLKDKDPEIMKNKERWIVVYGVIFKSSPLGPQLRAGAIYNVAPGDRLASDDIRAPLLGGGASGGAGSAGYSGTDTWRGTHGGIPSRRGGSDIARSGSGFDGGGSSSAPAPAPGETLLKAYGGVVRRVLSDTPSAGPRR